jgi:hypothetical protein
MTETYLQQAVRHVEAGRQRVARQEALIAELTRDGHEKMLDEACQLLEQMRQTLVEMEAHLAHEERKVNR